MIDIEKENINKILEKLIRQLPADIIAGLAETESSLIRIVPIALFAYAGGYAEARWEHHDLDTVSLTITLDNTKKDDAEIAIEISAGKDKDRRSETLVWREDAQKWDTRIRKVLQK